MTFTLILILNIVADVAILGALAYVMTRPVKLTPHAQVELATSSHKRTATERVRAREEPARSRLRPVLD